MLCSMALPAAAELEEPFRSWNQPFEPYRVIANIYYVGTNEISSFLITTPEGHILLDGGFEETAPLIKESIARLGFDLKDVKVLINSHAHFDHAGGLATLKRWTGAEAWISSGDAPKIATGARGKSYAGKDYSFEPLAIDRTFEDGEELTLGEVTLVPRITPGHTKGCTTWTMQVAEEGVTYQVVFVGSPNILSEMPLVGNADYPEIAEDFARTFEILKELKGEVFLGSHASYYRMKKKAARLREGEKPNPFVDPEGYRAFVEGKEKRFREALREQQEAAKAP